MTIPDIIYAYHEDIITRVEARLLIDALARMELSVSLGRNETNSVAVGRPTPAPPAPDYEYVR